MAHCNCFLSIYPGQMGHLSPSHVGTRLTRVAILSNIPVTNNTIEYQFIVAISNTSLALITLLKIALKV